MADHPAFDFEVVTPDGSGFRGRVTSVRLPGTDGSFGILARHAPLVGALAAGLLIIEAEGGKHLFFAIGDGFVEVRKSAKGSTETRALVDFCEPKDEIDVERARRAHDRAVARLKERKKDLDVERAHASLRRAKARLAVSNFTLAS